MFRRSLSHAAPFALALSLTSSLARAQTAPAASAPAAPNTPAAPTSPTAGLPPASGTGADVPERKLIESLEAKLSSMQSGDGLTADEAARKTLLNNPDVTAKQKSLAAADATLDATRAGFLPQLGLRASYTRLSKFDLQPLDFGAPSGPIPNPFPIVVNNYDLRATLSIPLSDYVLRLSNAMASAKHNKAAAILDERATRLAVARDARVYYYQWIRAQWVSYVAAKALEAARGHAEDAKNAFDTGLASRADVLRTVSQQKSAELGVARSLNNVAMAAEQLRVQMADPGQTNYEIGENVLADLPPFPAPTSPGAGYAEALEHRIEIRQLGESEAALREQAALARAGNYPRLDAQASAIYGNPNQRYIPATAEWHGTWDASVVLSWAPTEIFGATARAKNAEARADEVVARKAALKNALRLEVTQAMNALAEATFGLDVSRDGRAAAEENYRVRRELFRAGKATTVEVTDAETELTQARLQAVNAQMDVRIARVALTHALGRDVGTDDK
jgi:outer membrane protein